MIYSIAQQTGWTKEYIMTRISYVNLQMMLADAPRLVKHKENTTESRGDMASLIRQMPKE